MAGKIIEDKRISSRKRKATIRKFLSVLWIILIIALFVAITWGLNYFYNSDYFKIKNIEVKGNNYYKSEVIISEAKDLKGTNIFEIDKRKYETALMNNFARIKKAEILKVFPDKLIINITERIPFLIILYKNDYFLIDNEGVVLEKVTENMDKYNNLLIVKDAINYFPEIGTKIARKNILSSAVIYNGLSDDIKKKIKYGGIINNSSGDIYFETIDYKKIIFGNSNEIIKKNAILEQILKNIQNENIYYSIIDLRISDNPIVE
ncbi:MAG: FtsQ-type POTRA domain-containing protein [Actinobacteria bacterium]|nr:FtsQ-type POTRA domain-containing protein [Actinomycetota bacterium]